MINSFDVRDGDEPVDHRGEGSRGATNGARLSRLANRPREGRFVSDVARQRAC